MLSEIALLKAADTGLVASVPAVLDGHPVSAGIEQLADLLRQRGVPAPW